MRWFEPPGGPMYYACAVRFTPGPRTLLPYLLPVEHPRTLVELIEDILSTARA